VFEERVLRRIFRPKREEVVECWNAGEDCIMRSFMIYILHQALLE
jgi:hypothetical protein